MKRRLTLFTLGILAVVAFATSASAAPGIILSWDGCDAGVQNKTFACATNAGNQSLYASVLSPAGMDHWVSFEWTIFVTTSGVTLSPWWELRGTGQCRTGALSSSADAGGAIGSCTDAYAGNGGGGIGSYTPGINGANRARILSVYAVAGEFETVLNPDEQYFVAKMQITNVKTTGTGSCSGCTDQACIVLDNVNVVEPAGAPSGDVRVSNPADGKTRYIYWQGAGTDCLVVPAKNRTWGQIKAMYR